MALLKVNNLNSIYGITADDSSTLTDLKSEYYSVWSSPSSGNINWQPVKINTNEKENEYMENLYEVIVVNQFKAIEIDTKVVAKDEEAAKFSSGAYSFISGSGLTLDDETIIVRNLGPVKVKKESDK